MDNTLLVWPHDHDTLAAFVDFLNSCHSQIQFTMELGHNKTLPFEDILLLRKPDGTLGHTDKSALAEHAWATGHIIQFDETEALFQ